LNELKRLAAEDLRPVSEIYDELASNASTSLDTAAYFPSWDQARNTMYYSRYKRYPRLLARGQDLRLTAEQTTKSGAQLLMYHLPTNDILIFATEAGVRLLAQSNCWCGDGPFKILPSWYQQLFTLHVFMIPVVLKDLPTYSRIFEVLHSKAEELGVQLDPAKFVCDFETALMPAIQGNFPNIWVQGCFFHFCQAVLRQVGRLGLRTDYNNQEREWLPATKILLWNVHCMAVQVDKHLERLHSRMNKRARKHHLGFYQFLQLIIDEQGKTETVVRQMHDGYTRGRGFIKRGAAYGVQQRRVAALTGRLHRSEISIEHFLSAISYHIPAPVRLKGLPTYSRIFEVLHSKAEELGVQLDPAKFVCDFETALMPAIQGNFPNIWVQGCFFHFCQAVLRQVGRLGLRTDYNNQEREWLPATKILLWNVHCMAVQVDKHLERLHSRMNKRARKHHLGFYQFLQLIIDEQGKTETVVRQMHDGYTRGRGFIKRGAAYGVQQRRVAALTGRLHRSEISIEHFLSAISYHIPAPVRL
ncbi:hypothetical protein T11_9169, partial [Trichinella zimbabwensis]